jgi:hypothetical protein
MFTSIQNIICLIFFPNAADVNVKRVEEGVHGGREEDVKSEGREGHYSLLKV